MRIIPPQRKDEIQLRIDEALSALRRDGEHIVFETHAEFLISASLLLNELSISRQTTDREKEKLVTQTLLAMRRRDKHTVDDFEVLLAEAQSALLKSPKSKFHFLASARAIPRLDGRAILTAKISGVRVQIGRRFPKRVETSFRSGDVKIDLLAPAPVVPIWATVSARSELEAADKAVASIKAALGCINLLLNSHVERSHSGRPLPRNTVRLVGDQVVYRSDWSRFDNVFFYEEEAENPERWPVDLARSLERNRKTLDQMLNRLNDPVLGSLLFEAIQDYHEALCRVDPALVHFRLWGLLERLTNSQADESRTTIKRASFLFSQTEVLRQRLRHVADARHKFVHQRARVPFLENLSDHLRKWSEEILLYLFLTRRRFPNLNFYFKLLDAPVSRTELERAMSVLRAAKTFLK
ncbi:MAG: hypothetical protein LCH95_14615 [Proteobacteria bacterium]|nr:hypothetical protein [Pseudomonadota bacterium]